MANSSSAKKAARQQDRRRLVNKALRSALRTYVKKAETHISSKEIEAADMAVLVATRQLDRAVTKGLIKTNNAARRKSRLVRKLNAAKDTSS